MPKKDYSPAIAQAVRSFLVDDDWHFSFDEERGLFKFGLTLKGRIKKVDYVIDIKEDEYLVYAISPLNADISDKQQMAELNEFFSRANYGLKNGNFEFDVRDGEVRYKCFVDCEDCPAGFPSRSVIRNSILVAAAMFDRYSSGIVKILFANATAADTIEEIEGPGRAGRPSSSSAPRRSDSDSEGDDEMDPEVKAMLERLAMHLGDDDEDEEDDDEDDDDDVDEDEDDDE